MKTKLLGFLIAAASFNTSLALAQRVVKVENNQLVIDGAPQPQLFGAEVQYFRMRGGYGPNVPRAKVLELWNKALDRVVEAKMNAISFYIPWDFHEYADGKFDFTGQADLDGDGNPDYPSRDLVTFFKLIENHGIKRILVRPGPYINAEWGYLGFGAIPSWFHEKFPDSHMLTSWGWRTKLFDYANPDLLTYTHRWFETLYRQVLQSHLGPGKPIVFLQVDNETNYQWQSLYSQDYSPGTITRYQDFLKSSYNDLADLNATHGRQWTDWSQARPPNQPNQNLAEDRDWYRFADQTIYNYLHEIRKIWEDLGVSQPQVLFTLAESFNAIDHGLLPNFLYRNAPGVTGLMTVNLYPKTFDTPDHTLMNTPFKADLDVKSATEANSRYFGSHQEWAMGPEIQGGWWRGTPVSEASRQQTYLTVLGHGLKSFFVYYFNEGQNWDVEWAQKKIRPLYEQLKAEQNVQNTPAAQLSNAFWGELQARSDRLILLGFDVRRLMQVDLKSDQTLYFDAPIDDQANPRPHFYRLKMIGERVIAPYADFLARSLEDQDDVAFVKDSTSHAPSPVAQINSLWAAADWSGGLLGYLMNSDINPHILHGDLSDESEFQTPRALFHIDTGLNDPRTVQLLQKAFAHGQGIVNFLASDLPRQLGLAVPVMAPLNFVSIAKIPEYGTRFFSADLATKEDLVFFLGPDGQLRTGAEPDAQPVHLRSAGPLFTYDLGGASRGPTANGCVGILYWNSKPVAYRCQTPQGPFYQIGALIFNDFNSSDYANMPDPVEHRQFLTAILQDLKVQPLLTWSSNAERAVAFARKDPLQQLLWITVKTGTRHLQQLHLRVSEEALKGAFQGEPAGHLFQVRNLLTQRQQNLTAEQLEQVGIGMNLEADGSTVYVVERIH